MKRSLLLAGVLSGIVCTAGWSGTAMAVPVPVLDDGLPGVQAPMDSKDAVDWGKFLDNGDDGAWTFSLGSASAAASGGSSPRLIYFSSNKGAPDPRVNMPTDGWIVALDFEYSGNVTSLLSMENDGSATKREVQMFGPGVTGTPGEFRVDLRFSGVLAGPFQITENVPHTLTFEYLGLASGNLLDVWVDDTLVGTGDLDGLHNGVAYDPNSFAIGGGSTIPGPMTISVDGLIAGVPEPSTLVLLGLGAAALAVCRRRT